ncbi:MAG TPA: CBS domain-containing protein [Candidatus Aquabacterium excrementipullorum]|nr:CBS domain-containing protein [Candidatus Aquabacterium excrementipullorum]
MTQVSQAMTRGVRTISPADSLVLAAQAMDELNIGSLPVCDGNRLMGIVTDRDIVTRGVAQGCALEQTKVSDVMSQNVQWCFEDQSVEEVADRMSRVQIRRVPVLDREQQLVGMLSLGDMATKGSDGTASRALGSISEPAEPDRSSQSKASGSAGGGSASGKPRGTPQSRGSAGAPH